MSDTIDHWTKLFKMTATVDHFTSRVHTRLYVAHPVEVHIDSFEEDNVTVEIAEGFLDEMENIMISLYEWTEFYKNIEMINTEFYRRFKYQYADG